ncbi:MFS transporter [Anaerolineales bacterium HSG6]|nr:MFS transporter [Anaerolineales bacterium HSG6]MDM8531958.1 MFS transporter [Anaerolineales bacterium HSG25]
MNISNINRELVFLFISTFFVRVGFGASLILFDWTMVWGVEHSYGYENASSASAILLTTFAGITFLIAEVIFTGYYGNRSDSIGAKPVLFFATIGSAFALLSYAPSPFFYSYFQDHVNLAILMLVLYMAITHFLHGVFAAAVVSPGLGFVNFLSTAQNRTYNMAWYNNAILYGRAAGMTLGGLLWIWFGVDHVGLTISEQAWRIFWTFPVLFVILLLAAIIVYFGLTNSIKHSEPKPFSIKNDMLIAFQVMMEPVRRPLLLPWLSIAALVGSASLWGPSVAFRASEHAGDERGLAALLPITLIVVALALPAPFWGWYADHKGRKQTLQIGILGLPVLFGGVFLVYPLLGDDVSLSNPILLMGMLPGLMLLSALVPVLMGKLGDTASDTANEHGHVMSGYHFAIASGEIFGMVFGGLFISLFSGLYQLGLFANQGNALIVGFLIFEVALIISTIVGILRLPSDN